MSTPFDSMVGNGTALAAVRAVAASGRFPQAVVIEGPFGSGRRTLARLIAQAAVCDARQTGRPCGQCVHCRKAAQNHHPDIVTITGSGAPRSLSVSVVREVRLNAYIRPNEAEHKVVVFENAQSMTEQAQNALLKIMEEPPAYLLFLFTCLSSTQLLSTILSRSVVLTLGAVTPEEGLPFLLERVPQASPQQAAAALQGCGGILGPALEALEGGGDEAGELAKKMVLALTQLSEVPLLTLCAGMERDRAMQQRVLEQLGAILRDALAQKAGGAGQMSGFDEEARRLAKQLTLLQLKDMLEHTAELSDLARRNANGPLLMSAVCARLRCIASAGR